MNNYILTKYITQINVKLSRYPQTTKTNNMKEKIVIDL